MEFNQIIEFLRTVAKLGNLAGDLGKLMAGSAELS